MWSPPKCLESTAAEIADYGFKRHHREGIKKTYAGNMEQL
jgi:hypothetical protein|tara:strand:- start:9136 stop:9255 length:120 start_codon:yes stop_codon:yes gene_type:complete